MGLVRRWRVPGADPHHRDCTGNTPYSRALLAGAWAIADRLERAGCGPEDLHLRDGKEAQILATLGDFPHLEEAEQLVARGAGIPRHQEHHALKTYYADIPEALAELKRIEALFRDKERLALLRTQRPAGARSVTRTVSGLLPVWMTPA